MMNRIIEYVAYLRTEHYFYHALTARHTLAFIPVNIRAVQSIETGNSVNFITHIHGLGDLPSISVGNARNIASYANDAVFNSSSEIQKRASSMY
ncbi:MAG: hypothetical protein PVF13_09385, partial [Chromatiales bacterium]|jgi:hypothetical protein